MNYHQVLETIKDRLDIVDLVSERVPLKRRGRNFVGLCPFHAEKTPSFTVSPEKQMFYCFGCGAGGDAITFWMKIENLDFMDAVRDLADRLGIEMPKEVTKGSSKWEAYLGINHAAREFYQNILNDRQRGRGAREYLQRRGLTLETIQRFELGYAPPGPYPLSNYLEKKGFDLRDAASIGLLKRIDEETYVPIFRRRIIFPIIDERGRTVGFGGRALGEAQPKYLNTPDSMIFQKGRLFYGEAITKREIARERKAVLVEGYLDLISLYQLGVCNAIAALGTAFTDFHAKRLKRWADHVILLFDGDAAGFKASTRALEKLLRAGMTAYQGMLPEGRDPGDYLAPPDAEALKAVIEAAEDALLFRIRKAVEKQSDRGEIRHQEKRVKEGLNLLRQIADPILLDLYVGRASEILGLKKEILHDIVKNSGGKYNYNSDLRSQRGKGGPQGRLSGNAPRRPHLPGKRVEEAEEVVLTSLMQCPELSRQMKGGEVLEMFRDAALQAIGRLLLKEIEVNGKVDAASLMHRVEPEQQAILSRLMIGMHSVDEERAKKAFFDGLRILYRRSYREELEKLDKEIRAVEEAGDFKQTLVLLKRREAVKRTYQNVLISNHTR